MFALAKTQLGPSKNWIVKLVISWIASAWFAMQRGSCLHWCSTNLTMFVSNQHWRFFRSRVFASAMKTSLTVLLSKSLPLLCAFDSLFALQIAVQGWITTEQRHLCVCNPVIKTNSFLNIARACCWFRWGPWNPVWKTSSLPVSWGQIVTIQLPIHHQKETNIGVFVKKKLWILNESSACLREAYRSKRFPFSLWVILLEMFKSIC